MTIPFRNTKEEYGSVARYFHWLIFTLIAFMVAIGYTMTSLDDSPLKLRLIGAHKSLGICVLAVVVLRLLWKMVNIAPPLPAELPKWEKLAARAGHFVLYLLVLAMPLSGWAMSSAAGFRVMLFNRFPLPNLVAPDKALAHQLMEVHNTLVIVLIVVVALHALAALMHHFYHKNNVLRRMLPW